MISDCHTLSMSFHCANHDCTIESVGEYFNKNISCFVCLSCIEDQLFLTVMESKAAP